MRLLRGLPVRQSSMRLPRLVYSSDLSVPEKVAARQFGFYMHLHRLTETFVSGQEESLEWADRIKNISHLGLSR